MRTYFNALKTHCPQGHAYDAENTRVAKSGKRHCRTCERVRIREAQRRRREAVKGDSQARMVQRLGQAEAERRLAAREVREEARRIARKEAAARAPLLERRRKARELKAIFIQQCVDRLLREDATAKRLSVDSLVYRARYRYDSDFRAKELRRRYQQKTADEIPDDGTLTGSVDAPANILRTCPDCGRRMQSRDKSLDHIEPKSKGGWHSVLNTRVVCRSCNSKKNATLPEQLVLTPRPAA